MSLHTLMVMLLAMTQTSVDVLSVASQEEIAQNIKRIKELGLPPDETILDIDAIYTSENLLNETIEMLNHRRNRN